MKRTGIIENKMAQCIDGAQSPRLLTLSKAAKCLGLTTWAMRERVWAGQIPVVRFPGGRKMFVDVKDIDSFIDRNKTVFV